MRETSRPDAYDTIGREYNSFRHPDARIESRIHKSLGNAQTVCNIGAGAGSYEPTDRTVVAVEPSAVMLAQRANVHQVVQATAEALPFENECFDAAMAVLSVHHWTDPQRGLSEMRRVSRKQVVFTFDVEQQDSLWLVRDYLPEISTFEARRAIPVSQIADALAADRVEVVPIPHDCTDGFQAAYWRRPERYLESCVQASISTLAQLPQTTVCAAMDRLKRELANGEWDKKYGHLRDLEECDFGYRLIVAGSKY